MIFIKNYLFFIVPYQTKDLAIKLLSTHLNLSISDLDSDFEKGQKYSHNNITRNRTLLSYLEEDPL